MDKEVREDTVLYYKKGYKYQLCKDYIFYIGVDIGVMYRSAGFIEIAKDGMVTIVKGYACDGPSGLTIDTDNSILAAFRHDALYQLMRRGAISRDYKDLIDRDFRNTLIRSGMSRIRAYYWWLGVRVGGFTSTLAKSARKVCKAK